MTVEWISWRRRLLTVVVAAIAVLSLLGLHAAAGESATISRADANEKIANFKFQPTPLRIKAGASVNFANRSRVSHTATENGGGFDTGVIKPGSSAEVTFKQPGTYVFHCEIHPFMHGKIIVSR